MTIRANYNMTVIEGGTFNKTFQWKSGTPAVAVDLTGYTAVGTIRSKLTSDTPLVDLPFVTSEWAPDGDTGIYIYNSTLVPDNKGKFRLYIKDEDSEGICSAHKNIIGVYDVFLYNTYDEAVFQLYGIATIVASVTRDEG